MVEPTHAEGIPTVSRKPSVILVLVAGALLAISATAYVSWRYWFPRNDPPDPHLLANQPIIRNFSGTYTFADPHDAVHGFRESLHDFPVDLLKSTLARIAKLEIPTSFVQRIVSFENTNANSPEIWAAAQLSPEGVVLARARLGPPDGVHGQTLVWARPTPMSLQGPYLLVGADPRAHARLQRDEPGELHAWAIASWNPRATGERLWNIGADYFGGGCTPLEVEGRCVSTIWIDGDRLVRRLECESEELADAVAEAVDCPEWDNPDVELNGARVEVRRAE